MAKWRALDVITGEDGKKTSSVVVDIESVTHFFAPEEVKGGYVLYIGGTKLTVLGDIKDIQAELEYGE